MPLPKRRRQRSLARLSMASHFGLRRVVDGETTLATFRQRCFLRGSLCNDLLRHSSRCGRRRGLVGRCTSPFREKVRVDQGKDARLGEDTTPYQLQESPIEELSSLSSPYFLQFFVAHHGQEHVPRSDARPLVVSGSIATQFQHFR